MNVTSSMIDKQLRPAGKVIGLVMNSPSEAGFRRKQMLIGKLLSGRSAKGLQSSEVWISRRKDGSRLRLRIYRPLVPQADAAGVLWLHGGGYAIGLPEMSIGFIRRLIAASNCVVVAPDYCLSIEKPYPAALEDCYEALLWMKSQAGELGIRDSQLIIGGESAGGGLTAALSLYARDRGEVAIAFQMPLYPMLDDRMASESARDNNAPVWNTAASRVAWRLYLGELSGQAVPAYAAAARAADLRNLPPAVTFVGDLEPFRDETIEYVSNLRAAGVAVDFAIFKGCYHAFETMCPQAAVSQKAIAFLMNAYQYAIEHYFAAQKA